MEVKTITRTQVPQATVVSASVAAEKTTLPTESGPPTDSVSIGISVPSKTGKLGRLNDDSNTVALYARQTDQKLTAVADSIEKMKGSLEGIFKNFPPFPPESSERKELLMSYYSIRKELLKMTVPPPPPPLYEKVQQKWDELFNADASSTIKLPGDFENTTPDSDLKSAVTDLAALHDGVTSIRSELKQSLLAK